MILDRIKTNVSRAIDVYEQTVTMSKRDYNGLLKSIRPPRKFTRTRFSALKASKILTFDEIMDRKENKNDGSPRSVKVHVNCEVQGEPAKVLLQLKDRGLVLSNTDAISQGLLALYDRVIERDLKQKKLASESED